MVEVRPGADDAFVRTRKQLHAVAESLIAGPQYRASGTIRLAARPNGFTGVVLEVAVEGTELVWADGRASLTGPVGELATKAGIDAGPPAGAYASAEPLPVDGVLDVDGDAAAAIHRSLHIGAQAIKAFAPEEEPVLWPEHFDVAITIAEVNYGVSPGDSHHQRPYAYVGPWTARTGAFWNAPFGALHYLKPDDDTMSVVDFFEQGRRAAASDPQPPVRSTPQ